MANTAPTLAGRAAGPLMLPPCKIKTPGKLRLQNATVRLVSYQRWRPKNTGNYHYKFTGQECDLKVLGRITRRMPVVPPAIINVRGVVLGTSASRGLESVGRSDIPKVLLFIKYFCLEATPHNNGAQAGYQRHGID